MKKQHTLKLERRRMKSRDKAKEKRILKAGIKTMIAAGKHMLESNSLQAALQKAKRAVENRRAEIRRKRYLSKKLQEYPNVFNKADRKRIINGPKTEADRVLLTLKNRSRSKYVPHQGKQEMERRVA